MAASHPSSSSSIQTYSPSLLSNHWPSIRHVISGYFSGMSLILVGHPLDTLKVRLQTEVRFNGLWNVLNETVKKEGVAGLYKGVTPPLFLTGLINAGVFGMQGLFVKLMREPFPSKAPPTVLEASKAALGSGFFISFLVTPIEGVKSRLQIQYSKSASLYRGPLHCLTSVVKAEGLRGLYRGWSCVLFCRISNYAYFGSYEAFKQLFVHFKANKSEPLNSLELMTAGGFAGISYWFSCYPVDLIKARLMVSAAQQSLNPQPNYVPATATSIAKGIYKANGMKGFLAGFTPCLIRAFPANAAAFVTFEQVMKRLPDTL